jgi:tRNA C32,U32 (ribose-2'-O)-methylase TrmJ
MTQQERTELIREIKELLQLHERSLKRGKGIIFGEETLSLMTSTLQKCLMLSTF